jgi:chromosome partitioning protein
VAGTVITLAQQKGGSGKTTIAAHLAVAFSRRGKTVAVLDIDPQGSLGEWFERREAKLGEGETGLAFRTASGWGARREARNLVRDYDVVVIDTPPKSDMELRSAFEVADLVAVPLQPSPVDIWASDPTLQTIAKEGARSLLVVNRALRRALLTAEMIARIGALGHAVAASQLGNRIAFAASMGEGRTVLETAPGSLAAEEAEALAKEVLKNATR